jgi:cytochrome d ubiquinol oxidase subunit II
VLHGIRLKAAHNYAGNFLDLLTPYALLGGAATPALFTLHGAVFPAPKTDGELRARANALVTSLGLAAVVAGGGFLAWTEAAHRSAGYGATGAASIALAALAAAGLVATVGTNRYGREGLAFLGNSVAIVAATAALFTALYPRVLPSTISSAYTLTTANSSSTAMTLMAMKVVAAIFLPLVLAYQARTYWVFRRLLSVTW